MSEHEMFNRIQLIERNLQRLRLAIVIIAAFFIYQAIGPLSFGGDRVESFDVVEVKTLRVVNERGQIVGYLGSNGNSGVIEGFPDN